MMHLQEDLEKMGSEHGFAGMQQVISTPQSASAAAMGMLRNKNAKEKSAYATTSN
jgi:hypothetical protein